MPGSVTGLLIAVVVLIPGYVHYSIRRRLVPTRQLSNSMETAGLITVAVVSNGMALAALSVISLAPPARGHTPNLAQMLSGPREYIFLDNSRLAYLAAWAVLHLLVASLISSAIAYRIGPLNSFSTRFVPAIVERSGWYQVFEIEVPEHTARIRVICELQDGSYTAGDLAWFNTQPEDTSDRDLVLAPPLALMTVEGRTPEIPDQVERLIVSGRDIRRTYVTYLTE